jgi:3-oxoadipate enol-lactonase
MAQQDDFERGARNRRAVLGDAWVEQSLGKATSFNAEFQSLITRYAWHDIWGRPGLDPTTRRLLVLAMTLGSARWEEFELHCRAALRGGVPVDKIKETLMQSAIYCGVPAANTAFKLTAKILEEEGLAPPPEPLSAEVRVAWHHTFSEPQLRVAVQGQGAPVVLSHALGLDLHQWDAFAAGLAPRWQVARYDSRGHGGSALPTAPCRLDDLVDDAARLIREWGRGPVVWIGASMGGMVGQGVAIRHPELVRALVLSNTTSRYEPELKQAMLLRQATVEAGGMAAIVEAGLERFLNPRFRAAEPAAVQRVRETLLRCDPRGYAASCAAIAGVDWFDRLPSIRCPTLVIAGSEDVATPMPMGRAIADRIPGAQWVVIEGAAHLSVIDSAAAFAEAVHGFIDRLG